MNIRETIRQYISEELLANRNPLEIEDDTPLLTGGLIDSITTLELVEFMEQTFSIEFEAHEVDRENLDTLLKIERFVQSKLR